jgi:hypothetical protein
MAQYEHEDIPRPSNDMTIYRSICKYIESIEQVTAHTEEVGASRSSYRGSRVPSAQGVAPYQQQLRVQGVESAAAVEPVKGALNIHGIVQPKDKLTNKIKTKDNREKTVSYTATVAPCSICQKNQPPTIHNPKCWSGQCNKCNLYGHTSAQCVVDITQSKGMAADTGIKKSSNKHNAHSVMCLDMMESEDSHQS